MGKALVAAVFLFAAWHQYTQPVPGPWSYGEPATWFLFIAIWVGVSAAGD